MIKEIDVVALTVDLPNDGLKAGDLGTVVHVYSPQGPYKIEFVALDGDTIALLTLEAKCIREVAPREIAHVRSVA